MMVQTPFRHWPSPDPLLVEDASDTPGTRRGTAAPLMATAACWPTNATTDGDFLREFPKRFNDRTGPHTGEELLFKFPV